MNFTYYPQTNGQTERTNQSIINMLKTLAERNNSNRKHHIQKLVHVDNCLTHSSTYWPCYLLFGQTPKLPIGAKIHAIAQVELCETYVITEKLTASPRHIVCTSFFVTTVMRFHGKTAVIFLVTHLRRSDTFPLLAFMTCWRSTY